MRKICIVEDEPDIANLVAYHLQKEQFEVGIFYDGESFLKTLEKSIPRLVILDLVLPGIDGLDICRIIKSDEKTRSIPVIILTAKGSEVDIVLGLELGADDYMVKPFNVRELIARVKAILRRGEYIQKDNQASFGGISIDLEGFEVKVNGSPVDLTYAEFKTFSLLSSRPGRVFTRRHIIEAIWNEYRVVTSKTVDVHIAHLRRKLGKCGESIKTIRGVGYKFEP